MKKILNSKCRAFTLIETLAALTVGSMVLLVVLALYSRAQRGAAACIDKLENHRLPREVLQRIAEDLDRVAGSGQDARIGIENKFQDGLPVAKMEILRFVNDAKDQPQVLERIVWQSSIDPDSGLLTLYRSHSGISVEDKLLDEQKEPWQRELFVPICTGLTFFKIEVPQDNALLNGWSNENMPPAVMVTLSFTQPYKTVSGTLDVPEEEKIIRTVAIDRTRKPAFTLAPFDANQFFDTNQPFDANKPNDANKPVDNNLSPDLNELSDVIQPDNAVRPVDAKPPVRIRPNVPTRQPNPRPRGMNR
jgi:prepilin-type N-terminal cleavage/methylation domain-containing protein